MNKMEFIIVLFVALFLLFIGFLYTFYTQKVSDQFKNISIHFSRRFIDDYRDSKEAFINLRIAGIVSMPLALGLIFILIKYN